MNIVNGENITEGDVLKTILIVQLHTQLKLSLKSFPLPIFLFTLATYKDIKPLWHTVRGKEENIFFVNFPYNSHKTLV